MNVKWYIPFVSQNGTACRVNVFDNDWPDQAAAIKLKGAADPFYYEENDSDDLLNDVLRYRTGYIRIIEYNFGARDDIYPTSIFDRYVEFWYGNRLDFTGYIQMQDYSKKITQWPRVLELPVISPLGLYDKVKFNPILPPSTVTIGSLLNPILTRYAKVITPDISGIGLWQKIYSLVVSPWNENYHHSMNVYAQSKVIEPQTRAYLIEAICKAYGWICHDTPEALVFTSFDHQGKYISYPVGNIGDVNYRVEEITSQDPMTLSTYFSPGDKDLQQNTILPDTGIEVNYEGHLGKIEFNFDRTYYYDIVTMPGADPDGAERFSLCNLIPVAPLYEVVNVSTATFDQNGKVNTGSFMVAWNGRIGVLVSIGSYPSGHELFRIRIYNRNRTNEYWNVTYKAMTSEYSVAALKDDDEDKMVDGYIKTTKTTTEDYMEVAFTYNYGYNFGGTDYPMLPNNTLIFIYGIELERIEDQLPYAEYRYMPASDSDTLPSAVEHPAISSSVTMPISLYRLNDRMVGDTVRSTKVTEYPYLFQKRTELTGTFREAATLPDYYHARMFSHLSKRWRLIAQTFHPWDDEHILTLQHSNVLDGSASYVITTNAQNTSLEGYNDIVNAGVSFNHLLTAIAGYAVTSVTITMGGTDITSTAYNSTTGQISIASVTGDVVVTAVADTLYDAEVEYLQSNGNQYIDTGILPSQTLSFKCKFSTTTVASPGYGNVFGCRYASSQDEYQLSRYSSGSVSVGTRNSSLGFGDNTVHIVEFNGMKAVNVDGITKSITTSAMPDDLGTIVMFAIRQNGSVTQKQAGKIYYCKFGQVRDFIPVRKGNVGYMYDKISGKLFGNSGTGSFSYGNDITP